MSPATPSAIVAPPARAAGRAASILGHALRLGNRALLLAVHGLILTWMLHPSRFWIQGVAFVTLFALGPWLRSRLAPMRTLGALGALLLYALVLCLWRGFAYLADPIGSLAILGVPVAAQLLWKRPRWLRAALIGYLAWVAWDARYAPPSFLRRLAILLTPLAVDVLWLRPSVLERVGPHVTSSFLVILGSGALGGALYFAPDRSDHRAIAAQPGVVLVAEAGRSELSPASQVYSVVPDCEDRHAVVTVHKASRGLFALDLGSGRLTPFLDARRPVDAPVFSCETDRLWAADTGTQRVFGLAAAQWFESEPVVTLEGVPAGPGRIELARERDLLWHLDSSRNTVRVHFLASGALIAEDRSFTSGVLPLDGHRIIAVHNGVLSERALRADAPGATPSCDGCSAHLEVRWELPLAGDRRVFLSVMPNLASHDVVGDEHRAFVLSTHQGWLHAIDLDSRRETARARVPMGGRFLAYAAERDVVIGSGWTEGTVFFFRGRDLAHLRTVRVGARPRIVSLTHDQRRVLVGSGAGVLAIEVPAADAAGGP